MKKVIIIGSGIGGLASAIRMAIKGYNVTVVEKSEGPGGKIAEIKLNNFRFDAGPSLFTLPKLVVELFELAGKNSKNYFSYFRLNEICKYFYEDKTVITAHADIEKFATEVHLKLNEPKQNIINFLNKSKEKYNITEALFFKTLTTPFFHLDKCISHKRLFKYWQIGNI